VLVYSIHEIDNMVNNTCINMLIWVELRLCYPWVSLCDKLYLYRYIYILTWIVLILWNPYDSLHGKLYVCISVWISANCYG